MNFYFIDANIPMYWAGADSDYKKPCTQILADVAARKITAFTSIAVFQEILHRYKHIRKLDKGIFVFDYFKQTGVDILPVNNDELYLVRQLAVKYPKLQTQDLFHIAVMINTDIDTIISADAELDCVDEISRIDPLEY